MQKYFLLPILTLFVLTPAFAATTLPEYDIDPGHTRVTYTISHLGFINMPGHFNDVTGKIYFDDKNPEQSSVDVTIKTTSVSMDHDVLDKKLLGKEFFNADQFPTITFKSTSVKKTADNKGEVTGDLTFLGVTKPVTLKVRFNKKAWNNYMGVEEVGFSAFGKIKRSDFGMKEYIPDVGDDIKLYIEAEAAAPKVEKPEAKH